MHEFGLDRPLPVQYGDYVWQALHGDLGLSLITHEPVMREFMARFPATVELSLVRDAVRARDRPAGRHRRRASSATRSWDYCGDGRLAHRLLDADLLVGRCC